MRIQLKPLTVNQAWQGKRFKSPNYKAYEELLLYTLPKFNVPEGKLKLTLEFGFSNKASDIDNPVKPFLDVLQKKYGFNDKHVYLLEVKKVDVGKGEEYVDFSIDKLAI